jgi:small-conductance mechanosensitive channel
MTNPNSWILHPFYMREYLNPVLDLLNYKLFPLGQSQVTPLGIISFVVLMVLLIVASGFIKRLLINRLLARTALQQGARLAIGTITRYLLLFIGFVLILQTVGVDLTAFNVLAGAIGIGIGLGLQNVANNFISGLIILFERPIQVGDRIEVGKVTGEVATIGPRSTRIRTNDNITIIIPNSKFISENVINWSYANQTVRFRIPMLVTHDSDVDLVSRLMCEAAAENPDVAESPEPVVRLTSIDDSGMSFELRAWSKVRLHKPGTFRSDINIAIVRKFRDNSVSFADGGLLEVKLSNAIVAADDHLDEDLPAREARAS